MEDSRQREEVAKMGDILVEFVNKTYINLTAVKPEH
jgi:hypothetical protein